MIKLVLYDHIFLRTLPANKALQC